MKKILSLITISALAATTLNAQIIVADFDPNGPVNASITSSNVNVNSITNITATPSFLTSGSVGADSATVNSNLNDAGTKSWSFDFTVDAGNTFTVSGVNIDLGALTSGGEYQTSPRTYNFVTFEVFDGATGTISQGAFTGNSLFVNTGQSNNHDLDDSGSAFNLVGGDYTAVFSAADTDSGGSFFSIEEFTVNGSVSAIPEPSTAALLGLATLSLFILRRKR